jgi:hypothetical protein
LGRSVFVHGAGRPTFRFGGFWVRREPVVAGAVGLDAVVLAGLAMAQVFGWVDFSAQQNAAVVGFLLAVSGFVTGLVRSFVVPVAKFEEFQSAAVVYADDAYAAGFDLGLSTPVPDKFVWFGSAEGS